MTPPPCTCGETATGLVVEGHLHPYCAWQAERARAARLREAIDVYLSWARPGHPMREQFEAALADDRRQRA